MATRIESNVIPVVLTGHALKSLRDSGYTLPAAIGEVIDNSIEAKSNRIAVRLEESSDKAGAKRIHRLVFVDDGIGMDEETLHRYLQIGFSTRYMRDDTIGKYGVGAKLAALNFGTRIEVWSRQASSPWRHVAFDLHEALDTETSGGVVGIEPPVEEDPPADLQALLPAGGGTVVVWSDVDRLEEGRFAPDARALRTEVQREVARMFRYFLSGGIEIDIDGTRLLPHDPLFLMEGTYADVELQAYYTRLSKSRMAQPGDYVGEIKDHYPALVIANKEEIEVGESRAYLTVTLFPAEVIRKRGLGGDELARKLRIPDNQGSISFVRLDREINYTNVPRIFPRGVEDPDRFIGIEVAFSPELDKYFGVRNVKRGVEPHDALRRQIRKLLKKYVAEARNKLDHIWGQVAKEAQAHKGEHADLIEAVKNADRTLPKSRARGPEDEEEREQILDDLAEDVIGEKEGGDEARQEYKERIRDFPFVIESVDFPGTNFIDVQHLGGQVIIRLNTRHRFYREMWEPIRSISQRLPGSVSGDEATRAARRTIEALTLLLIAYGKAESMHEDPREQYGDLRGYWGQFLDSLMSKVKGIL